MRSERTPMKSENLEASFETGTVLKNETMMISQKKFF